MSDRKYYKTLFPKTITSISLVLVLFILALLSHGLYSAQKDIRTINEYHVPLVEYSASLIRINSDLIHAVDMLQSDPEEILRHKSRVLLLKNILSGVIQSMNELIDPLGEEFIERSSVNSLEDELLDLNGKYLIFDFEEYRKMALDFSARTSEKIETLLDTRDLFVSSLIKRNTIIFAICFTLLVVWLLSFIRLVLVLRNNIKDKDSLMIDLHDAKEDIEGLVRVISHDVATPLSVIFAYSGLDLKDADSEDNLKRMNAIKVCAKNIGEMLTHVKDMQAVKDGKFELNLEQVCVNDVLDEVLALFDERIKSKNLKINILVHPNNDVSVLVDRSSFKNQVLANIISNSIKFSEQDTSIDITVQHDSATKETGIVIRDYGIGMPKSISDNIFGTKEKTSRPGVEGEKGTGFGMPILKVYMDRYNAKVDVVSRCVEEYPDSSGTTFVLMFKA